jgi:uncharacterized membrane protein YdjX (TVP38/TMEM64 family)
VVDWVSDVVDFLGNFGIPIFLVLYFVARVVPVPSWPFPLAAGAWFGFPRAFPLDMAMLMAGSTCAFLISRYLLKGRAQKAMKHHRKLKAVDAAMREGGWKAVLLLQLSPAIPFGLQNYFLGASKARLRPFLVGTAIAGLPASLIFTGMGAGARFAATLDDEWKWAGLAGGVLATIVLTVWIRRVAKRKLKLA